MQQIMEQEEFIDEIADDDILMQEKLHLNLA